MAIFSSALSQFRTTSGSLDVSITNDVDCAGIVLISDDHLFRVQVNEEAYVSVNKLKIGFYDESARELIQALLDFAILNDYRPPK